MNKYIAWLDSGDGVSAARVGGKAASLARLGAAGFPVPPGFAVTVDGYHAFHEAYRVTDLLDQLLSLTGRPTPAQVREACAPILARLESSRLPAELGAALEGAYDVLRERSGADATYAVRSSGVSEDGGKASFAGLYESYINLRGAEAVADAVLRCYRCLWEPRAAHYRAIKGFDHSAEAMATVVMQTVRSAVSGVAFTLNPVTGARDEVLINASWGLGEAIVSGMVTPDNYVARKDGTIIQKDVMDKHIRVVPSAGGTVQEPTPPALAAAPALTDEQISVVALSAAAVEVHYEVPMDIEFAFDDAGRFYLLQARPVTTH